MGVKKQLQGHGDPLLMEVVRGLEAELETNVEKTTGGIRGVGERNLSKGDALFASTRHHQQDDHDASKLAICLRRNKANSLFSPYGEALFDPILEEYIIPAEVLFELKNYKDAKDHQVVVRDDLLKRHKEGSLFSSRSGAMYDSVLHEYILPTTSMLGLKALRDDMLKKRELFNEMKIRRDQNLRDYELYCDPLVHTYRRKELLFKPSPPPHIEMINLDATPSTYRKLNQGDDLLQAFMNYNVTTE